MKQRCVIIAARPISVQMREHIYDNDYIIAVDSGYENARKLCVVPDLCIGDFDSTGIPKGVDYEIVRLPREKNETDTYAAAMRAVEAGCKEVMILGGLGGRIDHTIANMQTLIYLEKHGIRATLADEENEISVLLSGKRVLSSRGDCYLSVYPIGEKATGVTLKYVRYELENAEICHDFPIGTSNEFRFTPAEIEVKTGGLFIVLSSKE